MCHEKQSKDLIQIKKTIESYLVNLTGVAWLLIEGQKLAFETPLTFTVPAQGQCKIKRVSPRDEDTLQFKAFVGLVGQVLNSARIVDQLMAQLQLSYLMQPQ